MAGAVLNGIYVFFVFILIFQAKCVISIEAKNVIGGESFTLTCGKKSDTLDHAQLHEPTRSHEHQLGPNHSYSVKHATDHDSGLYTCGKQKVRVNVTGLRLVHPMPKTLRVLENFDLEITVPILGLNSSGKMAWTVDHGKGSRSDISNLINLHAQKNTMTIVKASMNNTGNYTLTLEQKHQTIEVTMYVEVLEPIQFFGVPSNVSVDEKRSVLIRCPPNPTSHANITWYRNHAEVTCTKNCSITHDGLKIKHASTDMAGEYVCVANNTVQAKQHSIWLTVKTPPKELLVEVQQLMRPGYVNVTWEVVDTGGYPIQEFVLHAYSPRDYYGLGNSEGTMLLQNKHANWMQFGPLEVGEHYRFEVWARNTLGDGKRVWVNFTYTGPGNYTIATAQVKPSLFFHKLFNGGKYVSTMSRMQQTLLSTVLAMCGFLIVGGLVCKIACRMERRHPSAIRRRLRFDSEASDVMGLASDDTPRVPRSWSYHNPIFDERIFNDMPPMSSQMVDIPADSPPPTYDSLEATFEREAPKSESNKDENLLDI